MNKVEQRCQNETNAKFYYSSSKMLVEAKIIKFSSYILPIIPIILSFIPALSKQTIILTLISFSLTLILEFVSSFLTNYKERAIILNQLYETSICGVPFAKIEYDREFSNDLNEQAIRRSLSEMANLTEYHTVQIDKSIDDEYTYLYLVRKNSSAIRYLMSRMVVIYTIISILVLSVFIVLAVISNDIQQVLTKLIQFYPLIIPLIRNITSGYQTIERCNKVSADIDSYFLEGDDSIEILARFLYYVQNIEFELLYGSPTRYKVFYKVFSKGLKHLETGVTKRFISSIEDLKTKVLMAKGITIQTSKKQKLIGDGITFQALQKKQQRLLQQKLAKNGDLNVIQQKEFEQRELEIKEQEKKDVVQKKVNNKNNNNGSKKAENKDLKKEESKNIKSSKPIANKNLNNSKPANNSTKKKN